MIEEKLIKKREKWDSNIFKIDLSYNVIGIIDKTKLKYYDLFKHRDIGELEIKKIPDFYKIDPFVVRNTSNMDCLGVNIILDTLNNLVEVKCKIKNKGDTFKYKILDDGSEVLLFEEESNYKYYEEKGNQFGGNYLGYIKIYSNVSAAGVSTFPPLVDQYETIPLPINYNISFGIGEFDLLGGCNIKEKIRKVCFINNLPDHLKDTKVKLTIKEKDKENTKIILRKF